MTWTLLLEEVVLAIHQAQLAEHGGGAGLRDHGLLLSALARPQQLLAYGDDPDAAALAAAYAYGIARNHPFVVGNKRTAFVVMELFLELNGGGLEVDDASAVATLAGVAGGTVSEADLAGWIRAHAIAR